MTNQKLNITTKFKFNNKNYIILVALVLFLFVSLLYYSYTFKLGYLGIANSIFYLFVPVLILFIILKNKDKNYKIFWTFLLIIFLYVLADKYFRLHLKLSRYFIDIVTIDPVILVNMLYVASFIISLLFFYKTIIAEFRNNPYWLYLFAFAIVLKVTSIFSDLMFHDITEDYLELFSLYFFSSSFLLILISKKGANK